MKPASAIGDHCGRRQETGPMHYIVGISLSLCKDPTVEGVQATGRKKRVSGLLGSMITSYSSSQSITPPIQLAAESVSQMKGYIMTFLLEYLA